MHTVIWHGQQAPILRAVLAEALGATALVHPDGRWEPGPRRSLSRPDGTTIDVKRAWFYSPEVVGWSGRVSLVRPPEEIALVVFDDQAPVVTHGWTRGGHFATTIAIDPAGVRVFLLPTGTLSGMGRSRGDSRTAIDLEELEPYEVAGPHPDHPVHGITPG